MIGRAALMSLALLGIAVGPAHASNGASTRDIMPCGTMTMQVFKGDATPVLTWYGIEVVGIGCRNAMAVLARQPGRCSATCRSGKWRYTVEIDGEAPQRIIATNGRKTIRAMMDAGI